MPKHQPKPNGFTSVTKQVAFADITNTKPLICRNSLSVTKRKLEFGTDLKPIVKPNRSGSLTGLGMSSMDRDTLQKKL